ncbi:dTDP-4-dehydrorhamnose 3,5-epimerase family protein [Deinococcus sp. Marseille-Q6407]|uniref:dTDP-4-dehydrorhamnose 3,5-epimerase family protein n=1 Tax=Deinococcus sp. Marseille-Q6407 TaxID=2969223 RepID=UPI0021BDF449|nr:dTDP-4-dehydrorhamnose 3,5-epimerase family protein [Deinococcus sp. Marseille-Q6407]
MKLTDAVTRDVTFQTYGAAEPLEGVQLHPLRKHRSENGAFMEWLRLNEGQLSQPAVAGFVPAQLSVSWAAPGRVNAFHLHPREPQNELWTAVQGQLLVWLVDVRAGSATSGQRQRVLLSAEEPAALFIPSGVAHGYQAGPDGALLLYGVDASFDPAAPNEGRLPWDYFGPELWQEDRG